MKTKKYLKSLRLSFNALLLAAFVWMTHSCKSNLENEPVYLKISFDEVFTKNLSDWDSLELLVPQVGCSSCINLLIDEYQEQKIQTKLSMIGVSRERDLRLNYGEEFVSNPRVQVHSEIKHRPVSNDCYERPALLLSKADTVFYFCFKTDEVQDLISYLSANE
jgi:hypothetical protein